MRVVNFVVFCYEIRARGRLSTVDLLILSGLDQLLFILKTLFTFYKTSVPNEGVNRTETSLSFSVLWSKFCLSRMSTLK